MSDPIKVIDQTILDKWVNATEDRYQARKLITEAEMLNAQAKHQLTQFWDMVATEHGINVRTGAWNFDEKTQIVSAIPNEQHPVAMALGGFPPGTVIIQQDGSQGPDKSGMVS